MGTLLLHCGQVFLLRGGRAAGCARPIAMRNEYDEYELTLADDVDDATLKEDLSDHVEPSTPAREVENKIITAPGLAPYRQRGMVILLVGVAVLVQYSQRAVSDAVPHHCPPTPHPAHPPPTYPNHTPTNYFRT